MSEITFEQFAAALESTRGTAITAPTHFFPFTGMLTPMQEVYRRSVSDGSYENYLSERVTRKWCEWSGTGSVDTYNAPFLFNLLVKSLTSPSTPVGATLARLWSFTPTVTSDVQKSATFWWGDPNVQAFQAAYGVADSFTITADGTGTDVVMLEMGGFAQPMTKVSDPTMPTQLVGPELPPLYLEAWMDTTLAIGTTAVTGRLLSATLSADLTRSRKFIPGGPTAGLGFTRTGVGKRNATSTMRFEFPDTNEWDLMDAGTPVKTRIRISSDLIEAGYRHYLQWDIYGILGEPAWGEFEETNRTLDVTVTSTKNVTAGHSWALYVQNDRATL